MAKKRILFIQLPLINHSYDYIAGNVEYASSAIAGYILKHVTGMIELHSLPSVIAQFCSDPVIVKYIVNFKPDIVAITCFLWNIERSLSIAQSVKEHNSSIQIIAGGSEIFTGSYALNEKRDFIDYFVTGEGEWFFHRLLSGEDLSGYTTMINGNRLVTQPTNDLIPVEMIVEPFSSRRLSPMPDGSAFFELTRGCPYRCSYCLYSKNAAVIRELPFKILTDLLTDGNLKKNLSELYILSPALNTTREFSNKIDLLARINHGIRLHSEMRAGGMDKETARSLHRAGFRSMEVGLQTTNSDALKRVGRASSPEKEIEGMKYLKDAGIDLKIGLMPGLPGDTRDSFLSMADMLIQQGFKEHMELYPLMILPGTMIRDNADSSGINYLKKPPYYYNYGWGISFDDLRYITRYVEDATGLSHIVRKLPDFAIQERGLYCRGLRITSDALTKWDTRYAERIETNVFDFFILVTSEDDLYRGLAELIRTIPAHQLYNIILYSEDLFKEDRIIDMIQAVEQDSFMRRIHIFHEWKDGCAIRLYQVFTEKIRYDSAKDVYSFITPVFHVTEDNYQELSLIDSYEDNVLVARGLFGKVKKYLKKFADSIESVAFEDQADQEAFYRMIGYDYLQLPYTFKVLNLNGTNRL